MEASTIIQYTILFVITIFFSLLGLTSKQYSLSLKVISACCWAIMAITQYILPDAIGVFEVALSMLFTGFAFAYGFAAASSWMDERKQNFYNQVSED